MTMKKRVMSLLCAILMLTTLCCVVQPARAYATDYDQELQAAREEKEALQKEIDAIQADKKKVLEQKSLMDQRNDKLRQEVSLVQKQSDETAARIAELEVQEKEQYELFCKQMRQEEERGKISYWAVIFKATSFADLLSRIDFINEVMEYDQQLMEKLRATREQLASDKEALEQQKAELVSAQQELEDQIAEAENLLNQYAKTEAGKQAMFDEAAADEERIQEEIRRYEQELAQKNNNNTSGGDSGNTSGGGSTSNSGEGGFIWPTSATRLVTCPYGYRICPFHGEEYHSGVDIGAPYGSAILAAKSGTVIQAGWNGGYGISVTIAHEGGRSTLYGHMCDWNVSAGQQVSQGQVIGWCGSTGNSTGPHIHYGMYQNGNLTDPLPYLPGYVPYDW